VADEPDIQKQIEYYRARLDELAGQVIKSDSVVSRAKRELKQRRSAFALLSDLQRAITTDMPRGEIFAKILHAVQQTLKMDRSVILERENGDASSFRPVSLMGYDNAAATNLPNTSLTLPEQNLLVTAAAQETPLIADIRAKLAMPYFIAVPVIVGGRTQAMLVSGRLREAKPFFPPLDDGDVSTFSSIAGFLGAALYNSELFTRVRAMADSFARFVPVEFLKFMGRQSVVDVQLGDQTAAEMTILFSDIRSFTSISEKMTPKQTFDFINSYLRHAAPVIAANGGFIDKYIGDAIMALFPGDASNALRGAIALQRAADTFSHALATDPARDPRVPASVSIGVGLHTGSLMLGTIGFAGRMESTVISDAVNLASRMEGLTKIYGAGLLISGQTLARIADRSVAHRLIDRVAVVGKKEGVEVVEVFEADPPEQRALKSQTVTAFAGAFAAYQSGDFAAARDAFAQIVAANPHDKAAAVQLKRCERFIAQPPENWIGVAALDSK
jgi:class 3 adenylate cyclase